MKKIWKKPHMMTMKAQQLAAHIRVAAWSKPYGECGPNYR